MVLKIILNCLSFNFNVKVFNSFNFTSSLSKLYLIILKKGSLIYCSLCLTIYLKYLLEILIFDDINHFT